MEQLPLLLNVVVAVVWFSLLVALVRRPPSLPLPRSPALHRAAWVVLAVLALLAGGWGPQIWRSTTISSPPNPEAGQPVQSRNGTLRTPFAIVERTASIDGEGRVIRNERTTTLQLPLALLAFLAGVGWLRWQAGVPTPNVKRVHGSGTALCAAVLTAGLLAACAQEGPVTTAERPDRRIVDVTWDTLVQIRSELDDSLLFYAGRPTADADGFWVPDIHGYRIARFDWEGRLVRYVGASGSGPGEVRDFRLIDVDGQGVLWVLDIPNRRISGFGSNGAFLTEIALGDIGWTPDAFAVAADGEQFLLMETLDAVAPVLLDRRGRVSRGDPIPVPDARGAWGMALQGHATRERGGDLWVYAFASGDGFFRLSGTELVGPRSLYPEAIRFPAVIRSVSRSGNTTSTTTRLADRTASAGSVWAQNGELYIVFRGETEHEGRLLERYDLETGRYLDTVLLPRRGSIAMWEDRLVLVGNNPTTEVLVLRRAG